MSYDSSSNLLTLNNEPFPQPASNPPSSSSSESKQLSKLILRSALQKANAAVQCDSTNDVLGAINAYREAISLLERVLSTVDKENDRHRLQEIHDSYAERIRLLSTITSKLEPEEHSITEDEEADLDDTDDEDDIINNKDRYFSNAENKEPPIPTVSKSTPTSTKEFDLEKDEFSILGTQNTFEEEEDDMIPKPTTTSKRDSIDSFDSMESVTYYEQPSMALPSLHTTPIPNKSSSVFRARTSSLPRSPIMQRSSSMSTVETFLVEENTTPVIENKTAIPTPIVITRPIKSSMVGSIRKKAANRLSMDGLTRSKLANMTNNSNNTGVYGLFDLDSNNQQQQQEEEKEKDFMENSGPSHLKLLLALEKSMIEGAHITQKLYIPKNLWQQPNIRLSSMDIKVTACESLMNDIARLENWSYLDDLISSTRLLDNFETSVEHLQSNLSKKLKRDSLQQSSPQSENFAGNITPTSTSMVHSHSGSRDSMSMSRMDSGKRTQSFMSWGTKLTKSVERMNAFSLTKTEDQYRHYVDVLAKLFQKIHILENWLNHYSLEKRKSRQPQHDVLITKLVKICTVINSVIGGFVVRDITVLLAKWLKRGGTWVNE